MIDRAGRAYEGRVVPWSVAAVISLAFGCADGHVRTSGVTPFGPVRSALQMERAIRGLPASEWVVLASRQGFCAAFGTAFAKQVEANAVYADAVSDAGDDEAARCRAWADQLDRQAEIWAPVRGDEDRELWIGLGEAEDAASSPPSVTDGDGTTFFGTVSSFSGHPYAGAAAQLDCASHPDVLVTGSNENAEIWWITAGELALDTDAAPSTMSFTGDLSVPQGDVVGSVEADARLEPCVIEVE